MRPSFVRRAIVVYTLLTVLGVGAFIYFIFFNQPKLVETIKTEDLGPVRIVIGKSVEGRLLEVYKFGKGDKGLLFVGGIHGGYEYNSVLLAYQFIDYLIANPIIVPESLTVTVIPSANPDGVYKVTGMVGRFNITDVAKNLPLGTGRLNSDNVDLNRNFDCKWQATSTWQNKPESAGAVVFSEPETRAIRDYILKDKPVGVVFWHSMSNAVYASQCNDGILPRTLDIMNSYSQATGYPAVKVFDSYVTTGAADDWLASINIPAITVELKTHETTEWDKNLAGIKALIRYYDQKI